MKKTNVIYILSSGHSGSTLLNQILDSSDKIISVGELGHLKSFLDPSKDHRKNRANKNYLCDCGRRLNDCPLWGNVIKKINKNYLLPPKVKKTRILKQAIKILLNKKLTFKNYEDKMIYQHLVNESKKKINAKNDFIVDSSKSLRRLAYLNKLKNINLFVIHLVRDGRGVINSYKKEGKSFIGIFFMWFLENKIMKKYIHNKINKERYFHLSYDLFTQNPKIYIKKINEKFGLDIDESNFIEKTNKKQHHNFAGNSMRWKKLTEIKHDQKWKREMPKWKQIILTILCYIPNRFWVYNKKLK